MTNQLNITLPYVPRPWQKREHERTARFQVLALHRRAGKTRYALMRLIDAAVDCKKELGFYIYLAPFLKQARTIAWKELKKILEELIGLGAVKINEADGAITFVHNGACIRIFGGDNPDAIRGVRLDGAVIDEVAQAKPEVWQDIIQPALSDRQGWALFIGTPQGINLFSDLFFKAQDLPGWSSARYTVYDTNALDPDEVERLRLDMSETSFAREMLCDFSAAGSAQIISLAEVEEASKRVLRDQDISYAPKIIGVDPARFGDDRSVIIKRQGLLLHEPIIMHKIDNMSLAARVANEIVNWQPDAVFIDEGNGAGVIDRLRQLGHAIIGVHFGSKTCQPEYENLRAQMWFEMADWIRKGGVIPNRTDVKQDLTAPTYDFSKSTGKKLVESKAAMKARGMLSTDIGDSIACTFAFPVQPKKITAMVAGHHESRYSPLDKNYIAQETSAHADQYRGYDPMRS